MPRDHLADLADLTRQWRRINLDRARVRARVCETALRALAAGVEPGDVYRNAPMSAVWIRQQARAAGIPPGTPGPKPRNRR